MLIRLLKKKSDRFLSNHHRIRLDFPGVWSSSYTENKDVDVIINMFQMQEYPDVEI